MKGKRLLCPGAISRPTTEIDGHATSAAIPFEVASNASSKMALGNGRRFCSVTMCERGVRIVFFKCA
jgi:hypothetical protein